MKNKKLGILIFEPFSSYFNTSNHHKLKEILDDIVKEMSDFLLRDVVVYRRYEMVA